MKRKFLLYLFGTVIGIYCIALINVIRFSPIVTEKRYSELQYFVYTGAVHIHTVHSDGSGTVQEITYAAKNAGIDFVVIADHNAGPEARNEAGYHNGVLVLAGSELSMSQGHFLYIPHPDSILFEISTAQKRLFTMGDAGIVFGAHPFHYKNPLCLPSDSLKYLTGIETVNTDVLWRLCPKLDLLQAFITYPFLESAINVIAQKKDKVVQLWENVSRRLERRFPMIGSVDAHSNIKITGSLHWKFPSYKSIFKTVQTHIVIRDSLNGDYIHDARLVYEALRSGSSFIGLDMLGDTEEFSFSAYKGKAVFTIGDSVSGADELKITVPCSSDVRIYLKTADSIVAESGGSKLLYRTPAPGAYYVEIFQLRRSFWGTSQKEIPWIITNKIFVK